MWLYSPFFPQLLMTDEQIPSIVKMIVLSQNIEVSEALTEQAMIKTQTLLAQYG